MSPPNTPAPGRFPQPLPFRIPEKNWFSLREAGEVLGVGDSFVEKLYDQGHLTGHSHNAGNGERKHKRILRASLVAYAVRTKDYDDDSLDGEILSVLLRLPREKMIRLVDQARALSGA